MKKTIIFIVLFTIICSLSSCSKNDYGKYCDKEDLDLLYKHIVEAYELEKSFTIDYEYEQKLFENTYNLTSSKELKAKVLYEDEKAGFSIESTLKERKYSKHTKEVTKIKKTANAAANISNIIDGLDWDSNHKVSKKLFSIVFNL